MGKYLSKKACDYVADCMESYLDILETTVIMPITNQDYLDAVKTVKKGISKLRDGKDHKVLDPEKLQPIADMIEQEAQNAK